MAHPLNDLLVAAAERERAARACRFCGVKDGHRYLIELPYSEVCVWMGRAGSRAIVEFHAPRAGRNVCATAQIMSATHEHVSYPVLASEAGIYGPVCDAQDYYCYGWEVPS